MRKTQQEACFTTTTTTTTTSDDDDDDPDVDNDTTTTTTTTTPPETLDTCSGKVMVKEIGYDLSLPSGERAYCPGVETWMNKDLMLML